MSLRTEKPALLTPFIMIRFAKHFGQSCFCFVDKAAFLLFAKFVKQRSPLDNTARLVL